MAALRERNAAALERLDPALARRMRAVRAAPDVETARSGAATLRVRGPDGAPVRLHSAYDPEAEARAFADGLDLPGADAYVVAGVGLAHLPRELERRIAREAWLLLLEPREDVFAAALEHADLAPLLERPRTRLFVGDDGPSFLGFAREALIESGAERIQYVQAPASARSSPRACERLRAELATAVNERTAVQETLARQAETLETNAIRNLAFRFESAGVAALENRLRGVPGIVIGAGPSLAGELETLREVGDRAVMVAAGKALRPLVGHGIAPHFAAAVDMLPESVEPFRGFAIPERTALVYDPDCHHEIPRSFPGPKVSYDTPTALGRWAAAAFGPLGALPKGLSVAHTAFFLARALGLDPIVLVGVDLAFPDERTHAEGATRTWGGRVAPDDPALIEVPSVTGGRVRTYRSFAASASAFEREIARTPARVLNASPGGARIRGAESAPLAQALERGGADPVELAEVRRILARPECGPPPDAGAKLDNLERTLEDLRRRCVAGGDARAARDGARAPGAAFLDRLAAPVHLELRRLARDAGSGSGDAASRAAALLEGYARAAERFLDALRAMRRELRERRSAGPVGAERAGTPHSGVSPNATARA